MPDLDQLLDDLVTDVGAGTRSPGARAAIERARRRRTTVVGAVAVTAAAVVVAGGGLTTGLLADADRSAPVGNSSSTSPAPTPTDGEGEDAQPGPESAFEAAVASTLAAVSDEWVVAPGDSTILHPCAGEWSGEAGGSFGTFGVGPAEAPTSVAHGVLHFPSVRRAAAAVDLLLGSLAACTPNTWQVREVSGTKAMLASSETGTVWVEQAGAAVTTLEVPSMSGPPPAEVQVEIARLLRDSVR